MNGFQLFDLAEILYRGSILYHVEYRGYILTV